LQGHQDDVNSASFSPDAQLIVTVSQFDKTIRVWDLQGREVATFQHQGYVYSASFSSHGHGIVTVSKSDYNVSVNAWEVESLDQLLTQGCKWLHNYLLYADNMSDSDRKLCSITENQK
jgi:WD40 repeat protein